MKVSFNVGSIVKYREHDHDDWKTAEVLGRGGKVSRKCANFYNLQDTTSNETGYIDFEQLNHWQIQDNENVLMSTSKAHHLDNVFLEKV